MTPAPLVHRLGGAWFFTEPVKRVGAAAGLHDPFALYAGGRGGVLGDCDPAVVASAFAFFPPHALLPRYAEAVAVLPPRECARVYADGLTAWGQEVFGAVADLDRLAELARRVADSVHPMGLPLFTGWRAEPAPSQSGSAAALALHVLRELRGDLHVQAISACQLTPLQAIVGKDGPDRARELQYPEPYPKRRVREPARRRRTPHRPTRRPRLLRSRCGRTTRAAGAAARGARCPHRLEKSGKELMEAIQLEG